MTDHNDECANTDGIDVFSEDGQVWIHIGRENLDTEECLNFGFEPDDAFRFATGIATAAMNCKMRKHIREEAAEIAARGMVPDEIRPEDIIRGGAVIFTQADQFAAIVDRGCAVVMCAPDYMYGSSPEFLAGAILHDGRTFEQHHEEWETLGFRVTCEMDRQTGPVAAWLPDLFNPQR